MHEHHTSVSNPRGVHRVLRLPDLPLYVGVLDVQAPLKLSTNAHARRGLHLGKQGDLFSVCSGNDELASAVEPRIGETELDDTIMQIVNVRDGEVLSTRCRGVKDHCQVK